MVGGESTQYIYICSSNSIVSISLPASISIVRDISLGNVENIWRNHFLEIILVKPGLAAEMINIGIFIPLFCFLY